MSDQQRQQIAERLEAAGLGTSRFIDCRDGSKASVDHTQHPPSAVSGQYGIYATATDGLAILDVDDYDGDGDSSGFTALADLPPTLEQGSPHGGTHRLYAIEPSPDGKLVAAVLEDVFGTKNPAPSWGEVRVANQYVVGAGSQLDGCDKEWCDDCKTDDGGYYTLQADREIASITADQLVEVLKADPDLTHTDTTDEPQNATDAPDVDADTDELLSYARECDDKLDRLWQGDYSDYRDSDASGGVDRSKAESALAMKLAFWFQGDRQTIRQLMDRANTKKWSERPDSSYRDSVMSAVDRVSDYYDPSEHAVSDPSDFDPNEVERGVAILQAETERTNPAGELEHKNGCYGYTWQKRDSDGTVVDSGFNSVANFTIETLSYLETYEGTLMNLRIYPQNPREEPYEVQVSPTDFNEPSTFRDAVVRGRTTWFEAHEKPQQQILNELRETAGSQDAPTRDGTEFIGLHGAGYDEWVTPDATLSAEGWLDDPDHVYYEKGGSEDQQSSLEDKWQLDADTPTEYDESEVAAILERVGWTRQPARGLPILGWWYAAPLKPYVMDEEDEFNLLQVTGGTGAGKTSTLQAFYQLFGADPDPFGATDTAFTIEKKLSGSRGLPIWLDEYKPSDMSSGKLQWLHRRLREVTRGKSVSKGRSSLGEVTMYLRAPVVFSGEQAVTEPAVKRRTIVTTLSEQGTDGEYEQAFGELVGTSYEAADGSEQYPSGYNLQAHAMAYYQYVLQLDEDTIHGFWQDARETARDALGEMNVSLDGSEFQGIHTIAFGYRVFRAFAQYVNADTTELPAEDDLTDAISHVVSNIGPGGRRREHIDEFTELLSQAASADYIQHDEHYRLYEAQKWDRDVLAVHMPTAYSQVRRYVRDHNLDETTNLIGKGDYLDNFKDKASESGTYPLAVNHRVRGLENGAKAVIIDPEKAQDTLEGDFSPSVFDPEAQSSDTESEKAVPLANVSGEGNPFTTVTALVTNITRNDGDDPGPAIEATLQDTTGTLTLVDWTGHQCLAPLEEGERFRLSEVKAGYDSNGTLRLEPAAQTSSVDPIQAGVGHTAPESDAENQDLDAAADGGTEGTQQDRIKTVKSVVANLEDDHEDGVPVDDVLEAAVEQGFKPAHLQHEIEKLKQQGELHEPADGHLRTT